MTRLKIHSRGKNVDHVFLEGNKIFYQDQNLFKQWSTKTTNENPEKKLAISQILEPETI